KNRRAMLNCKRWAQVLRELCKKLQEHDADSIIYQGETAITVIALAGIFGTIDKREHLYKFSIRGSTERDSTEGDWKRFQKIIDQALTGAPGTFGQTLETLWEQVRAVLVSRLTYCGPISQTPPEYIEEARNVSKLLEIDLKAMFKKVSEQDYPEPKSWKGLNADGTPKTAKSKEAKPKKAKPKKPVERSKKENGKY
ncbi:unnamed protein product, partial [marine sediment metagenome]